MNVWTYTGFKSAHGEKVVAVVVAEDREQAARLMNMELDKLHIQKTGEANTVDPVTAAGISPLCSVVAHASILHYGG